MVKREEIVNFMTPFPRGGNFGVIRVKLMYFLLIFFSILEHGSEKLSYSNDDQGRVYQNCKFHDPWGRGPCTRAWPYKSYSENAFIL